MSSVDDFVVGVYPSRAGVSRDAAWQLAVALSPRITVRTQLVDAGSVAPGFVGTASIGGEAPAGPWALHLTDEQGLFHLICFDLDGKTDATARQARKDRDRIVAWLRRVGLDFVVCASGGAGRGWHIWLSLYEGVPAEIVHAITDRVKTVCPTLDRAPLGNLVTGCVRPPLAPHATGGISEPVIGDPHVLTQATTTRADLERLAAVLAEDIAADPVVETPDRDAIAELPADDHGHPYLAGEPRRVSPSGAEAIATRCGGETDASAVLFVALLSLARARRRFIDVQELIDSPGFEHVRTLRDARTGARIPRPARGPHSPQAVLARQWRRAVATVAASSERGGNDASFLPRLDLIASAVDEIQQRADAMPNRWASNRGAADRRVLDALCLIAVQAVTVDVDASIRSLALTTGINRETARTALWRLHDENWIQHQKAAAGTNAATWTIDPRRVLHSTLQQLLSQADPRAGSTPSPAAADRLRTQLHHRLIAARHDVFTSAGLGPAAGNAWVRISDTTASELDPRLDTGSLRYGPQGTRWKHDLDVLAAQLDVTGILERRAVAYGIERAMWRWWLDELTRMRETRRHQDSLLTPRRWSTWTKHPRRADGLASYKQARQQLLALAA